MPQFPSIPLPSTPGESSNPKPSAPRNSLLFLCTRFAQLSWWAGAGARCGMQISLQAPALSPYRLMHPAPSRKEHSSTLHQTSLIYSLVGGAWGQLPRSDINRSTGNNTRLPRLPPIASLQTAFQRPARSATHCRVLGRYASVSRFVPHISYSRCHSGKAAGVVNCTRVVLHYQHLSGCR